MYYIYIYISMHYTYDVITITCNDILRYKLRVIYRNYKERVSPNAWSGQIIRSTRHTLIHFDGTSGNFANISDCCTRSVIRRTFNFAPTIATAARVKLLRVWLKQVAPTISHQTGTLFRLQIIINIKEVTKIKALRLFPSQSSYYEMKIRQTRLRENFCLLPLRRTGFNCYSACHKRCMRWMSSM